MPIQPPTRPHTANPQISLGHNAAAFFPPRSASPSGSIRAMHAQHARNASSLSLGKTEWEDDAWDASSDKEDDEASGLGGASTRMRKSLSSTRSTHAQARAAPASNTIATGAAAIPIKGQPGAGGDRRESSASGAGGSASWSSSFQHINPSPSSTSASPSTSAAAMRPGLASSKTYTEGAQPPPVGTGTAATSAAAENDSGMASASGGTRLPPGGAWELVEEAEAVEVLQEPLEKVGAEAVRADVEEILRDPLQLLSSLTLSPSAPPTPTSTSTPSDPASRFPFLSPSSASSAGPITTPPQRTVMSPPLDGSAASKLIKTAKKELDRKRSVRTERKREKFAKVLKGRADDEGGVEVGELRRLAWSGIPSEVRPIAWQLLLNYLPLPTQPRLTTLSRKRKEYSQLVDQYFARGLSGLDQQIWHQIEIDVPRTRPGIPLWSCITTQRALERILYVWAIRHPASGYVQGINDLVCPFFQVFLSAYIDTDPELFDVAFLPPSALSAIEADTFWCLSKLLDGIQDNYISQQPGIQRLVKRMSELVRRIDAPLSAHFEEQGVEFMQFAFRWMNCLLMREMNVKCTIRMWDTYLAEGTDAFSQFHLYVCSALLVKYSERLRDMDFQEMIMFLQRLPTQSWSDHDVELLLSEAYVLKTVWQGAENHFANLKSNGGGFGMLGR